MKDKTDRQDQLTETLDRLWGFDSRRLQRSMTDGLAEWHRHQTKVIRLRRHYLALLCLVLLMVSCSYLLAPTRDYRLAAGVSYQEVASLTNHMLGK